MCSIETHTITTTTLEDLYTMVGGHSSSIQRVSIQSRTCCINNQYFNLFEQENYDPEVDGPYESILAVQNGNAILNGQNPSSVYGLWTYPGQQGGTYYISNNTQFRVSAAGSADIGDHAFQLGFEYEQRGTLHSR